MKVESTRRYTEALLAKHPEDGYRRGVRVIAKEATAKVRMSRLDTVRQRVRSMLEFKRRRNA